MRFSTLLSTLFELDPLATFRLNNGRGAMEVEIKADKQGLRLPSRRKRAGRQGNAKGATGSQEGQATMIHHGLSLFTVAREPVGWKNILAPAAEDGGQGRSSRHSCPGKAARMKIVLSVFGVLLILAGGVWFLQGINILPGSFMTGQTQWAVYGAIAVIAGIGTLVVANRRR